MYTERNRNQRSPLKVRIARRVTAIGLAAVGLTVAVAPPAHAWASASTGRPGTYYVAAVRGSHFQVSTSWGPVWRPVLGGMPLDVRRSPAAAGAQQVSLTFVVNRWNGSWVPQTTQTVWGSIGASQSVARMPMWWNYPTAGGSFRVGVVVAWYASNGATLGTVSVAYTGNDYVCETFRPCSAGTGSIYLG